MFAAEPPPVVDSVVVEAARLPAAPRDQAFSVTTVGEELFATAPRIDDVLTQAPGVQLFRRTSSAAANPTTQGITVRPIAGSGAGRALVTLDGVPLNDPFGGWVLWSGVPPGSVEEALIVRGAGAGPYGAGALTGTVQLKERTRVPANGEYALFAGERGWRGGELVYARGDLFLAVSSQSSDGWTPVRAGAGAADKPLAFEGSGFALRYAPDVGTGQLALRLSGYEESRDSGLDGAASRSTGLAASAALTGASPGIGAEWRLQGWLKRSDFENSSVAVGAARAFTTPANEQYGTPAWGGGFNAAYRHSVAGEGGWEVGADLRYAEGETRELFRFMAGAFTRNRIAGGAQYVAGIYGERWLYAGDWLLTGGLRIDHWSSFGGERTESDRTSGATTLALAPPDRDGWQPTARVGARLDLAGDRYVRANAYAGFRPPTLNELHRPFRVGNDVTESNPGLEPEVLYGAEAGLGGEGAVRWSAGLFVNRLDRAITNVTIGVGPGVFPVAGFIPAGGVLRQRQNAGTVEAWGVEADVAGDMGAFRWRLSGVWTEAEVDGGSAAPQLTGLRPAQTPQTAVTGEFAWTPVEALTLRTTLRYEGERFDDDLNTRELSAATSVDLRADWRVSRSADLYLAVENLTDADIETGQTADGIESFDTPRVVRLGLVWRP